METIIIIMVLCFLLLCLFSIIGLFLFDHIRFIWSPSHDSHDPKFSYKEYKALNGKLKDGYPTICDEYVRLGCIDYFKVYREDKKEREAQTRTEIFKKFEQRNNNE